MLNSHESPKSIPQEMVPGDSRLRRLALISVALLVCLGLWGILRFQDALDGIKMLFAHDPQQARERLRSLIWVFMSVHVLLTTSGSVYLVAFGIRCMRAGRYPPKGMRVLKDTRIIRGKRVSFLSALLILVGMLLLASNALIWSLIGYLEKLAPPM